MKYVRNEKYTKPSTIADVLKLALEKEKSSYQFYSDMAKKFKSPQLVNLLTALKREELIHIKKIKHLLDK